MHEQHDDEITHEHGVSRRDALKKGALIGTAAFVIPVVATISMSRASAQTTSGNHNGGPNGGPGGTNNQ